MKEKKGGKTNKRGNKASETAKKVLAIEAKAVSGLLRRIGPEFNKAIDILLACKGKVVITGIGKSGLIGRKIAATMSSTGTPAFFMHPAEGVHGDLGMLAKGDVAVALSNSGETPELLRIIPVVKRLGIPLIVMTGVKNSSLAKMGNTVLDVSIKEEACPLGLTPTASTTASLAMGDALAIALLEMRGFKKENFALLHPGGILGRKFFLKVDDIMHTGVAMPVVREDTTMKDAVLEISEKRLGVAGVLNTEGVLVGIITDGDLRRGLSRDKDILEKPSREFMTKNPKLIMAGELAASALSIMEKYSITSLFVMDQNTQFPVGIIHIHDILKAEIA